MIALGPLAVVVVWFVGAEIVSRAADARTARRLATTTASAAVAIALVGLALPDTPLSDLLTPGAGAVGCLAISLAGLLVAAMSPLADNPPATAARVCRLLALSCGVLAVRHATADAALLAVSTWLTWSAVRDRVYARYQVPAAALVLLGTVLPGAVGQAFVLVGVVVRLGLFPFQSWYPRLVARAPMSVVVASSATPAVLLVQSTVVAQLVGAVAAVVAALCAVARTGGKHAVAYPVIAANGLALAGAAWPLAVVASAGLAATVGAVAARRGPDVSGGDLAATPRLAVSYLVFGLALAGFPLLPAFADGHAFLYSAPTAVAWAGVVAMAVLGMAVLRGFLFAFTLGSPNTGERDLTSLERYAVTVALAVLLLTGLAPGVLGWAA